MAGIWQLQEAKNKLSEFVEARAADDHPTMLAWQKALSVLISI
jgi:hypothetical protein